MKNYLTGKKEEMAFSNCITIPVERSMKPRHHGINFCGDWGISIGELEGILESRGEYIDYVKFAVLSSRLYKKEYVKKKIEVYRKYNTGVFPGGMMLEAALINKKCKEFFDEAAELGFDMIEVSESEVIITPESRIKLVKMGVEAGFRVQVELGAHFADKPFPVVHTIKLCHDVLEAGASLICLEAAVINAMRPWENQEMADKLHTIIDNVGFEKLVFEIAHNLKLAQWFILNYGPDVNFGNVPIENVIQLEHVRRGMNITPTWFGKFASV